MTTGTNCWRCGNIFYGFGLYCSVCQQTAVIEKQAEETRKFLSRQSYELKRSQALNYDDDCVVTDEDRLRWKRDQLIREEKEKIEAERKKATPEKNFFFIFLMFLGCFFALYLMFNWVGGPAGLLFSPAAATLGILPGALLYDKYSGGPKLSSIEIEELVNQRIGDKLNNLSL